MTVTDDLAVVLELACLTEHRADSEQKALLRVAARLDKTISRDTVTNPRPKRRRYVRMVDDTRVLDDDDKPVPLPKGEW